MRLINSLENPTKLFTKGFPDSAFDKAQAVTSNSQLYKQAGNSVTVNVIAEIAKHFEEDEK